MQKPRVNFNAVGVVYSTCNRRRVATLSGGRPKKPSTLVQAAIRGTISDDSAEFRPAGGRYHLYVSLACPWAQRTLIVRNLKGLDDVITADVVHWKLTDSGWLFDDWAPACTKDSVNGYKGLEQIYRHVIPDYKGKFTVPVLWDKQRNTMVNNKSKDIVRMLNANFRAFCRTEEQRQLDLYPRHLREQIDDLEDVINSDLGQGVYKAGRAITDHTYQKAVGKVFDTLDMLDNILSTKKYLMGDNLTEVDVGLYTVLVRFDRIYYTKFKCNRKRIADYSNLQPYFQDLATKSPFIESTNFEHIEKFYQV
ncbi:hypothetical protein NP493_1171g00011 [Ridgeia piscesae]|uniref:GST C-terminal domain-containing protein n=1 Tax=Ridgeia piscesae TaxID=27915 RepID=A0AAD9NIU6_RIDPI|nr:hypothetical protein NP493_1171g00011 [Ridgeia piscesae]